MRRVGGARVSVSIRAKVRLLPTPGVDPPDPPEIEGWALNVSQGGIRLVLDGAFQADQVYLVTLGDPDEPETFEQRQARVIWVKQEADGAVVGFAFTDEAT